jgi:hypothetical protein
VSSLRLILRSRVFPDPHHKVSDDMMSTEMHQEGASAQNLSGKTMAQRTLDVKFPCGTQLTFGSLTFATGEDGDCDRITSEMRDLSPKIISGDSR